MKINKENLQKRGLSIITFFLGVVFVHFLTQVIMESPFPEIIKEASAESVQELIANLSSEIFSSLIKIYIISFVLFNLLPDKIKKSRRYLRVLYFLLFYFFCILIYVWI